MSGNQKSQAIRLSNHSLGSLASDLATPRYERQQAAPKIVHVGVGGFNRSHLAVYLDDLLAMDSRENWGEFGVGLLPDDRAMQDALNQQDYLYGVLERDANVENYRVIGSLLGHHYAPAQREAVLRQMTSPECGIVSLTVTEGGYFLDASARQFLQDDAAIQKDLKSPVAPATWVGYVAEAASRRMKLGLGPFTLMSCDNLQSNGEAARAALVAFADLRGGGLRAWIETNVQFPNSMVDRITPRTTDADREFIAEKFGVLDLAPVVTEPFRQWVLEDKFAAGRPPWARAGVMMTPDVAPYEMTKTRLLNGGHFCIAYFAALLGIETVAEAVADAQLHKLLAQFLAEVRLTLRDLPGIDLEEYIATILRRFANPTIRDQIARICSDGSAKITKFVLPSVADLIKAGRVPQILPLVIASWLRYQQGTTEDGDRYAINDPGANLLDNFVSDGARDVSLALKIPALFGEVFLRHPELMQTIQNELDNLRTSGMRASLANALLRNERSAQ
jgi:mannitol 2-dehydrogenase